MSDSERRVPESGLRMVAVCGKSLSAACLGQFDGNTERLLRDGVDLVGSLRVLYPALATPVVHGCSRWRPSEGQTLEDNIVHLEDCHGFSRDQIVTWLREQGF